MPDPRPTPDPWHPHGAVSRRALLGGAAVALAACTEPGTPSSAPPSAATGSSQRSSGRPTPATSTSSTTATAAGLRLPLVLAVHPTRSAGLRTTRAVLDAAVGGVSPTWADLGGGGSPLTVVRGSYAGGSRPDTEVVAAAQGDRSTVGVVRADALGPAVAAVPVDGVDPVTRPAAYPVTVPADGADAAGGPDPSRVVTTLWVGDIMLGRRVGEAIAAAGDPNLPFRSTAARLGGADLTVGNLECAMSKNGRPTQGGDSFAADSSSLAGLRDAGFDVLVLANNHLGDWGAQALRESVRAVADAGFTTVGAGDDLAAAFRPAVVERGGVRFGILAFNAIGETPGATDTSPGDLALNMPPRTGPLDEARLAQIVGAVTTLRTQVDVVVVYPHWGTQYTHDPVPAQRNVAQRLVEAGATAVIGTHPHWVQGMDVHQGRLIAHSLGNFVFDMTFSPQVQQGMALELVFWGAQPMAARLNPFHVDRFVPRFLDRGADGAEYDQILSDVWSASTGPFAA